MQKLSLTAMAREHPVGARSTSSGRSAKTVYGGHEHVFRQTVIAMAGGQAPRTGSLATAEASWDGSAGDLLIIPRAHHSLTALEDAAVLLTVAKVG
jgi:hypothetical protein